MRKMLIFEDDLLTKKLLLRLFKNNYEILFCESAEEFYQDHSINNYDIIIMDISLRGSKNGLELTKEIKALPLFSKTPIICLTAHAFMKDRTLAIESGADLFFSKPTSNKVLLNAVAFLIESKK